VYTATTTVYHIPGSTTCNYHYDLVTADMIRVTKTHVQTHQA